MLEPNQGRPSPCGSVRNPLRELHQLGSLQDRLGGNLDCGNDCLCCFPILVRKLRGAQALSARPFNLAMASVRMALHRGYAGNGFEIGRRQCPSESPALAMGVDDP